eukprot:CAMPEP_0115644692 /NCGR_PEP_ID=MMETSP0272-20121206/38018_1 /TAXON_ID=71861 /ORGANISM="Scrippsiella trochoidea, Strain CCMP3099" /LENGTH=593 /DNA_ID=CAMNT_0003082141 /DNA_START=35 /DNA_END=1818 /DNA_ORIENTATION=+
MDNFAYGLEDADVWTLAEAAHMIIETWAMSGLLFISERALQPFLEACLKSDKAHLGCGFEIGFHWTSSHNLDSIATEGLLVPDGVNVKVKHGERYGKGVYTSPRFGFGKDRYGDFAVLCIGLRGARETVLRQSSAATSSTARHTAVGGLASLEVGEQIIYRDSSQVLPCAVVSEHELSYAIEVADRTVALLYQYFPELLETFETSSPPRQLNEHNCSPAFAAVLEASRQFRTQLGGAPCFPNGGVFLAGKKTRNDLQSHTAFEHMQLTVLGLARLEQILPEVRRLNNGKFYMHNPGTQLLEQECGFTMHADREGTAAVLQNAPALLLRTFEVAKSTGQLLAFFSHAFDRHSDPCLEGRMSLLVAFLEEHLAAEMAKGEPGAALAGPAEAAGALGGAAGANNGSVQVQPPAAGAGAAQAVAGAVAGGGGLVQVQPQATGVTAAQAVAGAVTGTRRKHVQAQLPATGAGATLAFVGSVAGAGSGSVQAHSTAAPAGAVQASARAVAGPVTGPGSGSLQVRLINPTAGTAGALVRSAGMGGAAEAVPQREAEAARSDGFAAGSDASWTCSAGDGERRSHTDVAGSRRYPCEHRIHA